MGGDTFHKGKYYVSFRRNAEDCKKDITITLIRLFEDDSLKVLLSDDEDPSFLCVLNVTRSDYEDLKKQQGLLIDFDNFPAQLVRLLQQCATNNMFLILQRSNPLLYYFEIVEHNEFRKLVHLSLKTTPATDNDIKKHMSETINQLKKTVTTQKNLISNNESMWNEKFINMERKIHDLTLAMSKMEEDKLRRETEYQEAMRREKDRIALEKMEWQNKSEVAAKSQSAAMHDIVSRKEKQIEELNCHCKKLQENIMTLEYQLSDKSQRVSILEREIQTAHIDVATMTARNATFEKDILEKDNSIHQIRSKCSDYEKMLRENNEQIKELSSTVQLLKREKKNLEERMAISESLANKNNEAVHSTSEQLLKANQIISKQNSDLIEMKEKLLCRTAIALEQEKVIEKNSIEIEELKNKLKYSKVDLDKVNVELDSLKEKLEISEKSLKDKEDTIKNNNLVIQWLHKKMEENGSDAVSSQRNKHRHQTMGSSSSPYFTSKHNDSSHEDSGELPNFYATSRLSEIEEESPRTEVFSKTGQIGLDPKYLQPTMSGDSRKKGNNNSKKTEGKENKNVRNLPKVDYRDKKSSRSNTFRATPVSAYFP